MAGAGKLQAPRGTFDVLPEDGRRRSKLRTICEELFGQAIEWARRQEALSWELRAATSVARLWHQQARTEPAREILAPVYGRFTEGFGTADLRGAKTLLDSLG